MAKFSFEARNEQGVPVFGSLDADSAEDLKRQVEARGWTFVDRVSELRKGRLAASAARIPRLQHLRIGDLLREALSSELPAHVVVRSFAAEPNGRPLLGIVIWCELLLGCLLLLLLGLRYLATDTVVIAVLDSVLWGFAAATLLLVPIVGLTLHYVLNVRPRRLLLHLAGRLERGELTPQQVAAGMGQSFRAVASASENSDKAAKAVSDLSPQLQNSGSERQQVLLSVGTPIVLFAVFLVGTFSILAFVYPAFSRIYRDFGIELPFMTQMLVGFSDAAAAGGIVGWFIVCGLLLAVCGLSFWLLTSERMIFIWDGLPLIGEFARLRLQARMAQVIASMLRAGNSPRQALDAAAGLTGMRQLTAEKQRIISVSEGRESLTSRLRYFSALPVFLLFRRSDQETGESVQLEAAEAFSRMAPMLERASAGYAAAIGNCLKITLLLGIAFIVIVFVFASYLPLIRLLNDLA